MDKVIVYFAGATGRCDREDIVLKNCGARLLSFFYFNLDGADDAKHRYALEQIIEGKQGTDENVDV